MGTGCKRYGFERYGDGMQEVRRRDAFGVALMGASPETWYPGGGDRWRDGGGWVGDRKVDSPNARSRSRSGASVAVVCATSD